MSTKKKQVLPAATKTMQMIMATVAWICVQNLTAAVMIVVKMKAKIIDPPLSSPITCAQPIGKDNSQPKSKDMGISGVMLKPTAPPSRKIMLFDIWKLRATQMKTIINVEVMGRLLMTKPQRPVFLINRDQTMEPTTPMTSNTTANTETCQLEKPYAFIWKFTVELKERRAPQMMIKARKNSHKFLLLRMILKDYFRSVFCCSAPMDGGVGGYFLMKKYTSASATADTQNYAVQRMKICLLASDSLACYLTTRLGRTKPKPVPNSIRPVMMAVAKGRLWSKNQQVATFAGQLMMKGWPIATRMPPTRVKKQAVLTRAQQRAPRVQNPAPRRKLTRSPLLSMMWLAGKLTSEYTRKEMVTGALAQAYDMPQMMVRLCSMGMIVLLSSPLMSSITPVSPMMAHLYRYYTNSCPPTCYLLSCSFRSVSMGFNIIQ